MGDASRKIVKILDEYGSTEFFKTLKDISNDINSIGEYVMIKIGVIGAGSMGKNHARVCSEFGT